MKFILSIFCILSTVFSLAEDAEQPFDAICLTAQNLNDIMHSKQPVIIDVYSEWCVPCKYLAPIFSELMFEYKNSYTFVKVDGVKEKELINQFQIIGFPTILFIKDGKEIGRHVGYMGKEKFKSKIQEFFK